MPDKDPWDTVKLPSFTPLPPDTPRAKEPPKAREPQPPPKKPPSVQSAPKPPEPTSAKPLDVANLPATEACKRFMPSGDVLLLVKEDLRLVPFLELMAGRKFFVDAVQILAHTLPKREAVWWACRCARSVVEGNESKETWGALKATEDWILNPSEERRRAAEKAAEAANYSSPAACAALAVYVSGGSLAPEKCPVVAPASDLTAKAVANSVQLAALAKPTETSDRYLRFLSEGVRVLNGVSRWETNTRASG